MTDPVDAPLTAADEGLDDRIPVMTRLMRLPTNSIREARSIVRLQLDRLSPLPSAETVFDVVSVRTEEGQGVYAVGILRRAILSTPPYDARPVLSLTRDVDGRRVTFRFKNAGATSEFEARYLRHAPHALMMALGIAALALSVHVKVQDWHDARLPEIAAETRARNLAVREGGYQIEARSAWMALERRDAATQILCLGSRLGEVDRPIAISHFRADADRVTLGARQEADQARMRAAGAQAVSAADPTAGQMFEDRACA